MSVNKKEFTLGAVLMAGFIVVFSVIMMPIFDGQNGLNYLDSLFNSISKASANYMEASQQRAASLKGEQLDAVLAMADEKVANQAAAILTANGFSATATGKELSVRGDLGAILSAGITDSELLYQNDSQALESRYGMNPRAVVHAWWFVATGVEKYMSKAERFNVVSAVTSIKTKAIETAYNYYGIEAQKITDKMGVVVGALIFYVIYTLWYGFAILFMFEGAGFRLNH